MEQDIKYNFLQDNNYSSIFCEKFEPLRTTKWEVKFIDTIGTNKSFKPEIPFNIRFKRILNALHNTRIITKNIFINREYDKQQTYRPSKQHG